MPPFLLFAQSTQPSNEAQMAPATADVDVELGQAWDTVEALVDGFISLLPKLAIAGVVFLIFLVAAWVIKWAVHHSTGDHPTAALRQVLGRIAQWTVVLLGLMIAVAIVAPSVTPAKLLSALGIGGVAIGFAFKDILQNFLAGILILLRQPFSVGDQVVFGNHEGTVESIDTRSTVLKTYDGKRVLLPNGEVYTSPMVVLTAHASRRSQYDIGIGYGDDIGESSGLILQVLKDHAEIETEPAPDVLVAELAGSSINLRARWWTDPRRTDVVTVASDIRRSIKQELDKASIDMPYPTRVVLFHDQTEATDGDRRQQREGWPIGDNPPEPKTIATAIESQEVAATQ